MKLFISPLTLSMTELGFSVVNSFTMTQLASQLVLHHIAEVLEGNFACLDSAAEAIINHHFERFKDKPARILPNYLAKKFVSCLEKNNYLDLVEGDFVTDEEGLGYGNIYWRIVRSNSPTDVGPIHADRWFWELGSTLFPSSHRRVKVWVPLIQDDENPSLMVLPGSHVMNYSYGVRMDAFGKRKPTFLHESVTKAVICAPVRVGEAVIFHDALLHGGKTTSKFRVSLEFTLAVKVS